MMEKAEKYYRLLLQIRELHKELQWGEGDVSPGEEKKRLLSIVYAYRELGELDNCSQLLEHYLDKGTADQDIVDLYIRIKEINGRYLLRKRKYQEALLDFITALKTAEEYDLDFKRLDLYQSVSAIYEKIGDYKMSLEYYEKYSKLSTQVSQDKNYAYSKYLIDIYGLETIEQETRDLMERNKDLGKRINMDSLTGIFNRRFLHEAVTEASLTENKTEQWCTVMMDIDYFKQYNDTYGHDAGDKVLQTIGSILQNVSDERIFPIRYGGEEFLLIIKNPLPQEGIWLTEKVMKDLYRRKLKHEHSAAAEIVTISAGIATGACKSAEDCYRLIDEADKRLYVSKRTGRNKWTAE